jgi:hypothetical protein
LIHKLRIGNAPNVTGDEKAIYPLSTLKTGGGYGAFRKIDEPRIARIFTDKIRGNFSESVPIREIRG